MRADLTFLPEAAAQEAGPARAGPARLFTRHCARDRRGARGRPRWARRGARGIVAGPCHRLEGRTPGCPPGRRGRRGRSGRGRKPDGCGAGVTGVATGRTDSGWLWPASTRGNGKDFAQSVTVTPLCSSLGSSLAQNTQWPGWASPRGMAGREWTVGPPPLCPWLLHAEPCALGKGPVLWRSTSPTKKSLERSACVL